MTLLYLEALPPRLGKGTILKLLIEEGGLNKEEVGLIRLSGRQATIEIPAAQISRVVRQLDGLTVDNQHIRARQQITAPASNPDDHFGRLMRLMTLEAQAEEQQTRDTMARFGQKDAEQSGNTLIGLTIREEGHGMGGRILLTLGKRNQTEPLPWTRLSAGSPVLLTPEGAASDSWRGVVSQKGRHTIQVAFEKWPDYDSAASSFRLDLASDEIARQRQRAAMEQIRKASGDRLAELRRILLLEEPPQFNPPQAVAPLNQALNQPQQEAVQLALRAEDVAIIHGPPGTGKTTVIVEVIRQAVQRGEQVLACAPSNMGVDNIFEKLLAAGVKALRLGHPARVLPELREHTLDLLADNHPDVKLAQKLTRDAFAILDQAGKYRRGKPAPGERREQRQEARQMLADARRMEAFAVEQILNSADVLCATLTGLDSRILGQRAFDLAVIDEAGQSTEPAAWIPLLRARRLVLAGDHQQLPPTIVSQEAMAQGFGLSLMERLMNAEVGPEISRQLTVQYRMHEQIMNFSSQEFYEGTLTAHPSVAAQLLVDLPHVNASELTETAVHYIDTAGASYDEELEPEGESRRNPQEAALVQRKVEALLAAGVPAHDIAVITPYSAQVRLLLNLLKNHPDVEIDSVDGFQGREKEAVVLSLVRANVMGEIGFLADTRRMNVALTRARRKLIVIGDSATVTTHPFYQHWVSYCESIGAYQSVWEELY